MRLETRARLWFWAFVISSAISGWAIGGEHWVARGAILSISIYAGVYAVLLAAREIGGHDA